jgi:hypothetical protein
MSERYKEVMDATLADQEPPPGQELPEDQWWEIALRYCELIRHEDGTLLRDTTPKGLE